MDSPPPQRRLQSLVDDAIREILLRKPPDDPARLVRASAVSTAWFGIVSDPSFFRDYRTFHGKPPILGYLDNKSYESHNVAQFIPTGAFRPLVCERRNWDAVDSRHGRVLFYTPKEDTDFIVWDPITDKQQDACDHLGCHDGPFLVAFMGSNEVEKTMFASVYSSETTQWSEMISIENPHDIYPFATNTCPYAIEEKGHTAVVGKKIYYPVKWSYWTMKIVTYNVGEQELSLINLQGQAPARGILMGEEDGALVFAAIKESKLSVWSMEAGPNGVVARGQRRDIKLETILTPRALSWMVGETFKDGRCTLVGFANGAGVIFLNTADGLFTVEVGSGQTKKIHRNCSFETVIPYVSFYSREHARFVMPLQSNSYKK
ncbi:uncharacterized protein [Aegilops tauschii subsp. strangulata]|uniref:uncharacterized protein isoform X2 n=1 Tax=Aegilops tauschii subsp. strangulata TaxID=200361 RepID=UPI001E1CADAC|nr:uncharacterized protein LOC109746885 isoform X2 [Aegilops tauschii subsp. strangulata]